MIINRSAKWLYVEPPLTGSSAIAGELVGHYGGEKIIWKHAKYTEFRARFGAEADEYFVFATNRNPLDQAVSQYLKYRSNHRGNYTNESMFRRNGGFLGDDMLDEFAWVQETGADFAGYFRRYKSAIFNNWFLIGHEHFDFIIDFDDLADAFEALLRRIGVEPVRRLPRVNATEGKKRSYAEYFTPEIQDQAFRCYGPFMKKWGFDFPAAWGTPRIPLASRVRFSMVDRSVRALTRHINLDSESNLVQKVKRRVQSARA